MYYQRRHKEQRDVPKLHLGTRLKCNIGHELRAAFSLKQGRNLSLNTIRNGYTILIEGIFPEHVGHNRATELLDGIDVDGGCTFMGFNGGATGGDVYASHGDPFYARENNLHGCGFEPRWPKPY
jgi:hypothetical protein